MIPTTRDTRITITKIYDFIHPDSLRPGRACYDIEATHASLGLHTHTTGIRFAEVLNEFVNKPRDTKYAVLYTKTASVQDSLRASTVVFKNNVDLSDMATLEEGQVDLSPLIITPHAWTEWCRHRARIPYTHPDFTIDDAKRAFLKLKHVSASVSAMLTWQTPMAHSCGIGAMPGHFGLFSGHDFRHLFVVCDYNIVHYEFSDTSDIGRAKAIAYAKAGGPRVTRMTFSKSMNALAGNLLLTQ